MEKFEEILKLIESEKIRISIVPDLTTKNHKKDHVPQFALYIIRGDERVSFPFNKHTSITRMKRQIEVGIAKVNLQREIREGNE